MISVCTPLAHMLPRVLEIICLGIPLRTHDTGPGTGIYTLNFANSFDRCP
jgi:hypothetical protein